MNTRLPSFAGGLVSLALAGCATGPDPMSREEMAKRELEWQRKADAAAAAAVGQAPAPPSNKTVATQPERTRTSQPAKPSQVPAQYKQLKAGLSLQTVHSLYPNMEKYSEGVLATGPWSDWIANDGVTTTRFRFESDRLVRWNRTQIPTD